MPSALEIGFELDRRWHFLRGEMDTSKKPDLIAIVRLLDHARVPYAIIGGVALQIHQTEPRTTIDIDIAVASRDDLPAGALEEAGFVKVDSFQHSENWRGPGGTPIQFSDDSAFAAAIDRAVSRDVDGATLRVLGPVDLVRAKLRAARDPARRRSKRLQDLADAVSLVEVDAALATELTELERTQLADA
jgi:hypothetical protein